MDLKRKLDNLEAHLTSISGHSDEDAAVRLQALDLVIARAKAHKDRVNAEVQARIAESFGPTTLDHVSV